MIIDFVVVLCIALVAIAVIEWLKKPLPKVSPWLWWALAPVVCVALGILIKGLTLIGIFVGLLGFAFATLFYDNVIQWAKAKIDALKG